MARPRALRARGLRARGLQAQARNLPAHPPPDRLPPLLPPILWLRLLVERPVSWVWRLCSSFDPGVALITGLYGDEMLQCFFFLILPHYNNVFMTRNVFMAWYSDFLLIPLCLY